jgi:hypothetical protein
MTNKVDIRAPFVPFSQPLCVPEPAEKEKKMCVNIRDLLLVDDDITMGGINVKASKADDAPIDTWLWDSTMVRDFPQLSELARQEVGGVNRALHRGR